MVAPSFLRMEFKGVREPLGQTGTVPDHHALTEHPSPAPSRGLLLLRPFLGTYLLLVRHRAIIVLA